MGTRLTAEQRDAVAEALKAGKTIYELSAEYRVSTAILSKIAVKAGVKAPKRKLTLKDYEAKWNEMKAEGLVQRDIIKKMSDFFGLSSSTIKKSLKGLPGYEVERPAGKRTSDDDKKKAYSLYKNKASIDEIARETKLSKLRLQHWIEAWEIAS